MSVLYKTLNNHEPPVLSLYTGEGYFAAFKEDIDRTDNGTVALTTMGFNPAEPRAGTVIDSLAMAAGRGVDVTFVREKHFSPAVAELICSMPARAGYPIAE